MTEFSGPGWGDPRMPASPPGYPYPPGGYPPPRYAGVPPLPPLPPRPADPSHAVAALILGILAVVTAPVVVGLGLGVAAVAMGLSARRRSKRDDGAHSGMALAGIVLGALAIVVGLAVAAILAFGFATGQFNEDYQHCLGYHSGDPQACEQFR